MRVEFRPAAVSSGIVFVRCDQSPPRRIEASPTNRLETPRRTTLGASGVTVEMVEHVMAALGGMHVDNCEVWLDNAELPGCDGSSMAFVEALLRAGIVEQDAWRPQLVVTEVTRVGDENCWIEARPATTPGLFVKYRLDYGTGAPISRQTIQMVVTPESFQRELAPARTFILKHEAEWLRERGLGARVTCGDLLVFDDDGPLENELRFPDECVRHKALDLVGDLALTGCDFVGQFVAHRSGHRLNAELVKAILMEGQMMDQRRRTA